MAAVRADAEATGQIGQFTKRTGLDGKARGRKPDAPPAEAKRPGLRAGALRLTLLRRILLPVSAGDCGGGYGSHLRTHAVNEAVRYATQLRDLPCRQPRKLP